MLPPLVTAISRYGMRGAPPFPPRIARDASSLPHDASSALAPNAPAASGPAAVRSLFTVFFAIPDVKIGWTPDRIDIAQSGELGYSSGRYSMDFTGPGGKPVHDKGKYLTVWKKQADGSWKVLLDAFNSDLAPQ